MQPQDRFFVNNLSSDGQHMYNQIVMNKKESNFQSNMIMLSNKDDEHGYVTANFIEMDAHMNEGGAVYNRTIFNNYSTVTGTQYQGNYFGLFAGSTYNTSRFINYKLNQVPGNNPQTANYLYLNTNSTDNRTRAQLLNKNFISDQDANYITLESLTAQNTTWIYNRHTDTDKTANGILMYSNKTDSKNYLQITNRTFETDYNANEIKFTSDSSGNVLELNNRNTSNAIINSLKMSSDSTIVLWSGNDLKLRSAGAVRIYANYNKDYPNYNDYTTTNGNGQDVWIGGYTIKLQMSSGGLLSLYWGSKRYNISEPSLSSGQTGNLQVKRV